MTARKSSALQKAALLFVKVALVFAVAGVLGVRLGTGKASLLEIITVTVVAWAMYRLISSVLESRTPSE